MKFRTKLYLSFILLSLVSILFAVLLLSKATYGEFFEQLRSHVTSIAATTGALIDGNVVDGIKTVEDTQSAAYKELLGKLRKARDANRRNEVHLKYLYIFRPDPKDPHRFLFVMDAEESPKDVSDFGDENLGASNAFVYDYLNTAYSPNQLSRDQWGEWITGYAPIYNSKKEYSATVGADISSDLVKKYFNRLFALTFPSFFGSLVIALIAATIFSRKAVASLREIYTAAIEIGKGHFDYRTPLKTKDEFGDVAAAMNQMAKELEERSAFKKGASQYVSQHILDKISSAKGEIKLKGERRKITVLFADIVDFTFLSEKIAPEIVVSILNDYFTEMLDVILKYNGTIDKLIGDAIMAEFGIPIDDPEQERNSVMAAKEMQRKFSKLSEKWSQHIPQGLKMSIGIHTGEAIVGTIGDPNYRMEYTAIGDTVNIAARLKQLAKEKLYTVLMSEATFKPLNQEFPAVFLGPLKLPGKESSINGYKIEGI